jgi:hypothetical protein
VAEGCGARGRFEKRSAHESKCVSRKRFVRRR